MGGGIMHGEPKGQWGWSINSWSRIYCFKRQSRVIFALNLLLWFALFGFIPACSTRKNTPMNRFYHQTTSYFNYYFNANDAYQQGVRSAMRGTKYDYTRPLPLELMGNQNAANATDAQMDRVVEKCAMLIKLHSIVAKPARGQGKLTEKERKFYSQSEYNKYARKAWLLIGKAHLWNANYEEARRSLAFAQQQYAGQYEGWEANVLISRLDFLQGDPLQSESRLKELIGQRKYTEKDARARFLVNAVYADLLLSQGRYKEALPMVEEAWRCSKRGPERMRVTMVLAQVKEQLGDTECAVALYRKVARRSNDYALSFNAKLRMVSLAARSGGGGMERDLERMARDVKNSDYLDQIYFSLAELAFAKGDTARAIELLQESALKSVSNAEQKTLSYITLGEHYYAQHDYLRAATFYDSAVRIMPSTYPKAVEHQAKGLALRSVSKEVMLIAREDSLQRVARMPESERMELIHREIERVKEAKHQEEMARQQEMQDRQFAMQNQYRNSGNPSGEGGSAWYFYNASTISFGRQDFKLKWGDRKLEDDWRRANRQVGAGIANEDTVKEGKGKLSNLSVEYYLHDLPMSDSLREVSNRRIAASALTLGEIYQRDIQDAAAATEAYTQLPDRFPEHPRAAEALYRAFNSAEGIQDGGEKSSSIKARILRDYPTSHYARMLADPDFLIEQRRERDSLAALHSEAFKHWQSGNRAEAYRLSDEGVQRAKGHEELLEKFGLLRALSAGPLPGSAEQVQALKDFARANPTTQAGRYADEVVQAADRVALSMASNADSVQSGDSQQGATVEVPYGNYSRNFDTVHWVLLLTPRMIDFQQAKFTILSFYVDYDINLTLDTEFYPFSDDLSFLIVKDFPNAEAALKFVNALEASNSFEGMGLTPRYSVISPANYRLMLDEKSVGGYLSFYNKYYRIEIEE